MTERGVDRYAGMLRSLAEHQRLRGLSARSGIDFASNDYLGLAASARLRAAVAAAVERGTAIGATGSRLLRGNAPEHEELEAEAARFFGSERSLFFGGGYVANFALLTTLPQRCDLVVLDDRVHASMNEGAKAGRAASTVAAHNSVDAMEVAIRRWRAGGGVGRVWIAVESLYSMDGDRAPLPDLVALADRHDAFLLIDEAHATGVYGPDGRGLAAQFEGRDNVIVLHTCGKALGGCGALVSAPAVLCDFLVNRCRPFIFATAPSPLMAVAALESLAILRDEPDRRARLAHLVTFASDEVRSRWGAEPSGSQILPFIVGEAGRTMNLAARIQARGFDVRGVRPPTVVEGTARLRVSLTLHVDVHAISGLFDAIDYEFGGVVG